MRTFLILLFAISVASCCDEFKSKSCNFTMELSDTEIRSCRCHNKPYDTMGCDLDTWICDDESCSRYGVKSDGLLDKPTDVCLQGGHTIGDQIDDTMDKKEFTD